MADNVNHPGYYNIGTIEVIDAVNDWKLDFDRGNVVKYLVRAGLKDPATEIEDLEKAQFYLTDYINRRKAAVGQY